MTHDELNAALSLQRKIDRLQARLDDLRQTGGVGGTGTNTPVQGGSGVFAGQIASEKEDEIAELQKQLEIERVIIQRYLDKSDLQDDEKRFMAFRYVKCWKWEVVAIYIGYTKRHTLRLHEQILKKLSLDVTPCHLKAACQ